MGTLNKMSLRDKLLLAITLLAGLTDTILIVNVVHHW